MCPLNLPSGASQGCREYSSTTRLEQFFYYSSTRNFLLLVTISTSVHLFLVIFGFCEVLMGTSDAHFGTKTFRHWCQTVSRTLRHGCRSVWDTSAPCTGQVLIPRKSCRSRASRFSANSRCSWHGVEFKHKLLSYIALFGFVICTCAEYAM